MENKNIDWSKRNILKTNTIVLSADELGEENYRSNIEPWLSAIFQSEHFSLLIGSGLTTGVTHEAGIPAQGMGRLALSDTYRQIIGAYADRSAAGLARGFANLEDDLRTAFDLLKGFAILSDQRYQSLKNEVDAFLDGFIKNILKAERDFKDNLQIKSLVSDEPLLQLKQAIEQNEPTSVIIARLPEEERTEANLAVTYLKAQRAFLYLKTFLLSFASRAASRERLNIFTTNYDRFIEFACDEVGIILLDRFKGKLTPTFRNTKLELDYHYNPPGIRGEPRYVEGVVKLSKIHGSIDWRFDADRITRSLISFGAPENHPDLAINATDNVVIYPNSSKDIETAFYPYAEIFRDFSAAICRPNSCLVTFGYGFGDTHVNRIVEDMLTIPSTHLVIISFDAAGGKIEKFFEGKNRSQFTIMIGPNFGNLISLVDNYLPKATIDRLTIRMQRLKINRGEGNFALRADDPQDSDEQSQFND
jgi:SIR2-like domain